MRLFYYEAIEQICPLIEKVVGIKLAALLEIEVRISPMFTEPDPLATRFSHD